MRSTGIRRAIALAFVCVFAAACWGREGKGSGDSADKVLMIGNSFSISCLEHLPSVAQSCGVNLDLASLYIGGCSLERHWHNVEAATNAIFRPYRFDRVKNGRCVVEKVSANIPEALAMEKWDVVTIQQASHLSWDKSSYHPWGDRLVAKIHALAPQARIVVQETWSYTPWDKRLAKWRMDQGEMYARLHSAYSAFAAEYGFRVIPMGTAVQEWRRWLPVKYTENSFGGDVVGGGSKPGGRFKRKGANKWTPTCDVFHLNSPHGTYFQALVWTASLFDGVDVTKCAYVPKGVSSAEAKLMREIAAEVAATPYTRDLFSDTWDAIDGLGRRLGTSAELPTPRKKTVGIFYWTWHQFRKGQVLDNEKLLAADPTLPSRPTDNKWGLRQTHYWGEPLFGYYATTDAWVLRRHAQLLNEAGVDVVVFDATNGTLTWMDSLRTLMDTWGAMRMNGEKTPQFAYMLPFWPGKNQAASILQLFRDVYKPGLHRDLWFNWNGKPLIHATPELVREMANDPGLPEADRRDYAEIARFFTFRPLQPAYAVGPQRADHWCWLEAYPQHAYGRRADGTAEMCGVGVAQNHSWLKEDGGRGLAAMNDRNVFGRAYMGPDEKDLRPGETLRFASDCNPRRGEPNRFMWGDNLAQQFRRAREIDPDYLFVTGWNEFIAGNFDVWQGKKGAFPDQYSPEFSRDIEPSNGILKDHFYYQLVNEVRRFRGVRPQRAASRGPVFRDALGDTDRRDAQGYGNMRYTDDTGRNDIVECFVAHDAESVTFRAVCAALVTPPSGAAWMRLFISTHLDADDPSPHWNHMHFVVNRIPPPDGSTAVLERSRGGWSWSEVAHIPMTVEGKVLTLKIPRKAIGQTGRVDVRFKWADNTPGDSGDILDFYRHGDAAPDGRFLYHYFE